MLAPPPIDVTNHALFLDFDGTLIAFGPTPNEIEVSQRVHDILDRLHIKMSAALAFVSGRGAENLSHHLGRRDFMVVGGHGAEWMLDGENVETMQGSDFACETELIAQYAVQDERLVLETKLGGLTLHFRQAPDREDEVRTLFQTTFAERDDFEVMDGNQMLEARRSGANKGAAIARLMALPEFMNRKPVFLGDDVTDEFGFLEVNRRGGMSIKVGNGETCAQHRLSCIGDVLTYLEQAA